MLEFARSLQNGQNEIVLKENPNQNKKTKSKQKQEEVKERSKYVVKKKKTIFFQLNLFNS